MFCGGLILPSRKALSLEAGVLSEVIPYTSLGIVPDSPHLWTGIKFGTDFKIVRRQVNSTLKERSIAHHDPLSHLALGLNSCRRTLFSSTV